MPPLPFPTRSSVALVAVGDPGRDRTVYATIVLLVALGFAMILLAVWLMRTTRPDPEVLAPLERMGQRKWRRADPVWQRRHLDEMRPGGADPLEPSSAPPATDADFERGPQTIGFEDLASDAPSVAATADLPAPSGAPLAVDGSLDVERADELTPGEGTAEVASDVVAGEDAAALAGDGVVEGDDGTTVDDEDDDEDITGEQDTDDFLAVLDLDDEPESDIDTPADLDAEPEADAVIEPDVDGEADAVVEPEVDVEADEVVEPEVEAEADATVEPEVDADADAVVEPEVDGEADAVVEPTVSTPSTSNDDEPG